MTAAQTAQRAHEEDTQRPPDRLKSFIETRLARRETPTWIAHAVRAYFDIEIDPEHIVPFWKGEIALPTQTERRQDKESVQMPADAVDESLFTRLAPTETPPVSPVITPVISEAATPHVSSEPATPDGAKGTDAPATQTGHRQDEEESLQIPADTVDAPTSRDGSLDALGDLVKKRLGIAPDPAPATQTGHGPDRKFKALTDEVKTFIVKGLARYETPTRVAASVQMHFGIAIDRRQVFAYDPAGSRRPAQRWIDLHAATRAKFNRAIGEIGVAQQVVRLRMLDRYANRADESNQMERAAAFLVQAAKECGGFYERYARPKAAAMSQEAPPR